MLTLTYFQLSCFLPSAIMPVYCIAEDDDGEACTCKQWQAASKNHKKCHWCRHTRDMHLEQAESSSSSSKQVSHTFLDKYNTLLERYSGHEKLSNARKNTIDSDDEAREEALTGYQKTAKSPPSSHRTQQKPKKGKGKAPATLSKISGGLSKLFSYGTIYLHPAGTRLNANGQLRILGGFKVPSNTDVVEWKTKQLAHMGGSARIPGQADPIPLALRMTATQSDMNDKFRELFPKAFAWLELVHPDTKRECEYYWYFATKAKSTLAISATKVDAAMAMQLAGPNGSGYLRQEIRLVSKFQIPRYVYSDWDRAIRMAKADPRRRWPLDHDEEEALKSVTDSDDDDLPLPKDIGKNFKISPPKTRSRAALMAQGDMPKPKRKVPIKSDSDNDDDDADDTPKAKRIKQEPQEVIEIDSESSVEGKNDAEAQMDTTDDLGSFDHSWDSDDLDRSPFFFTNSFFASTSASTSQSPFAGPSAAPSTSSSTPAPTPTTTTQATEGGSAVTFTSSLGAPPKTKQDPWA
ncbi:hypothetical protein BDZ89DRAFT_1141204 [Hymenopellis radicata]|nr:hypothetical protein BDZ89DRAFT_1141204 [Hymenopellis radicata]